jgi:hypothetical protein
MSEQSDQAVATLRRMADRIEHNKDASFGGACVIVLPQGEAIEFVTLDAQPDEAQFISTIATRLQLIQTEMAVRQRTGKAFGR